ncbi:hypothetical protein AAH978_10715 [Streptomyces sp. ZYX-F-203]
MEAPTARLSRASASPAARGEQIGLVRPYPVTHERLERERRRAQRPVVRMAVHGVDTVAQLINGLESRAW